MQVVGHLLRLLLHLEELLHGVDEREQSGVVAAAADGTAQFAEIGGAGHQVVAHLFRKVARPLPGVGEEFAERKTAIRFVGGHKVQPCPDARTTGKRLGGVRGRALTCVYSIGSV